MDLGLAFSFPFQDEEWIKKFVIAAVLLFIPVVGWLAVFGWTIEITRRVIRESEEPLPDWTEFADLFVLGLKGFVIGFVYWIPILLIFVPVFFISLFGSDIEGVVAFLLLCIFCISIPYLLLLGVVLPASFGILADSDNLAEAINPSKILALLRAAPGPYVITAVGAIIAIIVANFGVILCFVGVFFTTAYTVAFQGHLIGQAYKEANAAI